jgi:type I restriction enzyme S subunit
MELKEGYKQTDVGVIPEDWGVKSLIDIVDGDKSLFDDGDWIESEFIIDEGIRLVQTGNIGVGRFIEKDTKRFISQESFEFLKCKKLRHGDILICRLAEPAGRACLFHPESSQDHVTSVDITIFRPSVDSVSREFLSQFFASPVWLHTVSENAGGTTHKRISRGRLGRLLAPLPSLREQQAIAEVLSDVDAEIESLARRHEKLLNQKQGLSEELLSGRIRLVEPKSKGFKQTDVGVIPEDWEVCPLGEVCHVIGGGTPSTSMPEYWGDEINWYTPSEVGNVKFLQGSKRRITSQGLLSSGAKLLPKGTILLTTRASIGEVGILTEASTTNQGFQSLVPNDVDCEFLYYLVATLKPKFVERASGSTFLEISPLNVKSVKAVIPPFREQQAIAEVLSDVDVEIQAVAKLKAKVQAKKEGLMQTLLTGKIRLT